MIYFNGKILPTESIRIDPTDRGFLLGDGLFETMRVYQGKVFGLREHWNRLKIGAEFLHIPLPLSEVELASIILDLLRQNNLLKDDASLRLTVTRGPAPRGLLPPGEFKPTIMLTAFPFSAHHNAARLIIASTRRNELSPTANIKSLNYLDNILAKMEATQAGETDAALLNSKGNVSETCAANIFIVTQKSIILTPRLQDGALPGITRQLVIRLARELNLIVEERVVTIDDLKQAEEIFLTNSLIEIQPVSSINKLIAFTLSDTSLTKKLHEQYQKFVAKTLSLERF